MQPDKLLLALRPRSHWEALDQGMVIGRHWFWPLLAYWLLTTLPALLLLALLLRDPFWVTLIFWWMLPLWERPLLFVLSRRVFDEQCTIAGVWRAMRGMQWREMFYALTIRRFNPARSMDAPVALLERPDRVARRQREYHLHDDDAGSAAFWLTLVGAHVVGFLSYLLLLLPLLLNPAVSDMDWLQLMRQLARPDGVWQQIWPGLCYYLAMGMVAPFYVASGFSLYLNRRMALEGWDIEIAFRRLRSSWRLPPQLLLTLLLPMLLAPMLMWSAFDATAANAATNLPANLPMDRYTVAQEIEQINRQVPVRQFVSFSYPIVLKAWFEEDDDEPDGDKSWFFWLSEVLLPMGRWLLLGVFLSLLAVLLWRYRQRIGNQVRNVLTPLAPAINDEQAARQRASAVARAWVDSGEQALQLLQQGEQRAALALLYRGALALIHVHLAAPLPPGCSEGECLLLVDHRLPVAQRDYLHQLVQSWLAVAYGGAEIDSQAITTLCLAWRAQIAALE